MIEIDFKDRVPTYAGRVKLTPVEGQSDLYDMEREDDPVEVGTPIDKATLNTIVHSRLTGRYYTPTVERVISSNSRLDLTVSPIPSTGWVYDSDNTNRATSGMYAVATSSNNGSGWQAHNAFSTVGWQSNGGIESWITIYHAIGLKVKAIRMAVDLQYSSRLTSMKIQGSYNGTEWTDIAIYTSLNEYNTDYPIGTQFQGDFFHYRLLFTSSAANRITITNLAYAQYDILQYQNNFTQSKGFPSTWDENQRVTIFTPAAVNTATVTSNTINGIPIYSVLQPSRRYELIYNNGVFCVRGL